VVSLNPERKAVISNAKPCRASNRAVLSLETVMSPELEAVLSLDAVLCRASKP
jgi:hypothetical protein